MNTQRPIFFRKSRARAKLQYGSLRPLQQLAFKRQRLLGYFMTSAGEALRAA
jgi:hypothetical protein